MDLTFDDNNILKLVKILLCKILTIQLVKGYNRMK